MPVGCFINSLLLAGFGYTSIYVLSYSKILAGFFTISTARKLSIVIAEEDIGQTTMVLPFPFTFQPEVGVNVIVEVTVSFGFKVPVNVELELGNVNPETPAVEAQRLFF